MSTISRVCYLQTYLLFCGLVCSAEPVSFGITTDKTRPNIADITLTLYWNKYSFECTIQPAESNHLYQCPVHQTRRKELQSEVLFNKIHIISRNNIPIKSINIKDNNGKHYEINHFCSNVNVNDDCQSSINALSTIIQFPIISNTANNSLNRLYGIVQHIPLMNQTQLEHERRLFDTGSQLTTDVDPTSMPTTSPTVSPTNSGAYTSTANVRVESVDGFENNAIYEWIDTSDTNKIIALIGVSAFLLIFCLICHICYLHCCKQNTVAKPDGNPQLTASNTLNTISNSSPITVITPHSTQSVVTPGNEFDADTKQIHSDEYRVEFTSKPLGLTLQPLRDDKLNLYVSQIVRDGEAYQKNVKQGSKLIAINDENIEGIAPQQILTCLKVAGVPVRITFRHRNFETTNGFHAYSDIGTEADANSNQGSQDMTDKVINYVIDIANETNETNDEDILNDINQITLR